tara:strand:+ start:248 stop:640 length:393 start_codon:yes stop_codon:yes gene_type:complete
MKINKQELQQLIKEEIELLFSEQERAIQHRIDEEWTGGRRTKEILNRDVGLYIKQKLGGWLGDTSGGKHIWPQHLKGKNHVFYTNWVRYIMNQIYAGKQAPPTPLPAGPLPGKNTPPRGTPPHQRSANKK